MKILLVNKFYFRFRGAETNFFALKEMLERAGHEVVVFAMHHPQNEPSKYAQYFVSQVKLRDLQYNPFQVLRILGRMIYSLEARCKLNKLIKAEKPELAHLHNIYHHLSPSILSVLKKAQIPVVQTLHDYKLLCPNYKLFTQGEVCERCQGGHYCQAIKNKCMKDSYIASVFIALEKWFHNKWQIYEKNIDVFVSPSEFLKNKAQAWGIKNRFEVINNFVDLPSKSYGKSGEKYFLYFGSLSPEKNIQELLEAYLKADLKIKLKIVGEGESRAELAKFVSQNNLSNQVEFLGFMEGEKLQQIIAQALVTILPTKWYENYPFTVLESLALGVPVVATKQGGLPEMIQSGETGWLYDSGQPEQLAQILREIVTGKYDLEKIGQNGQNFIKNNLTSDKYWSKIKAVYESLLNQ